MYCKWCQIRVIGKGMIDERRPRGSKGGVYAMPEDSGRRENIGFVCRRGSCSLHQPVLQL